MKKILLVLLSLFILTVGGVGLFYYVQRDIAKIYEADVIEIAELVDGKDYVVEEVEAKVANLTPPLRAEGHKGVFAAYIAKTMEYLALQNEFLSVTDEFSVNVDKIGDELTDESLSAEAADVDSMSISELETYIDALDEYLVFNDDKADELEGLSSGYEEVAGDLMVEMDVVFEDLLALEAQVLDRGYFASLIYQVPGILIEIDLDVLLEAY